MSCKARIWRGFSDYPCGKTALHSGYCGTHDPERKAARRKARGPSKFERECAAMYARHDLERRTVELLKRIDSSWGAMREVAIEGIPALLAEWREAIGGGR